MTGARAPVGLSFKSGRWLLPWMGVVLVSATLAYRMNGIAAGGLSASDQQPDVQVAAPTGEATGATAFERSTTSPSGASADHDRFLARQHCAASCGGPMYVGVDWWIVAESQRIAFEPGGPVTCRPMAPVGVGGE
jgi:hypothetical protein